MTDNSETQDIVETVATENTDTESQEIKEWGQDEAQEPEQAQDENQEPEKQEPEPEKPKKSRAQERIEQLARENAELKRWRSEQEAAQQKTELKRPTLDTFETYSEYEQALEDYYSQRAENRVLDKLNEQNAKRSATEKEVEYQTAVAELEDSGIDVVKYSEKANSLPVFPVQLDQVGLSAKETLLLAKDLLDDEETYIELSQMSQIQAAVRIGQIIEGKKTKAVPPVSKAPKPIKPVQANAPVSRDPSKMSDDEWYKAEIQKRKGK